MVQLLNVLVVAIVASKVVVELRTWSTFSDSRDAEASLNLGQELPCLVHVHCIVSFLHRLSTSCNSVVLCEHLLLAHVQHVVARHCVLQVLFILALLSSPLPSLVSRRTHKLGVPAGALPLSARTQPVLLASAGVWLSVHNDPFELNLEGHIHSVSSNHRKGDVLEWIVQNHEDESEAEDLPLAFVLVPHSPPSDVLEDSFEHFAESTRKPD